VTGTQGSAVAKTFLDSPGWQVRGITRSIDAPAAQNLSSGGVELATADLDDKSSLVKVIRDSHAIFANTDFLRLDEIP
jgi:uncharacterized protein YbjT (DUF2867 family)